jgi:predicted nucleic acid-binding protein
MTRVADSAPALLVLDASAVVALGASAAPAGDALLSRVDGARLHAPDVLAVEVDSVLRGLVLGGRLTERQGDAARRTARSLPIELWPWAELSDRAWELRANLSSYDAGYVALAELLEATLLTGDGRLARASGPRCGIEVLTDVA